MSRKSKTDSRWSLAACTFAVAAAAVAAPVLGGTDEQAVQSLQKYCQTSWRNAGIEQQEWSDCTQQAVAELIERISTERLAVAVRETESQERRELNRTVWRIIQRWRRSPRLACFNEQSMGSSGSAADSGWGEVDAAARGCLSPRQRQILDLLRDGWRVPEIAEQLELSAARISDEKYKAVRKLRAQLSS